jgi:ketosteroid isomerase-like protein
MTPAEELDSVRRAYMGAFNAGDADGVAALHTLASVTMPAGMAAVTGRDSVRKLLESSLSLMPPGVRFRFEPLDVRITDGWAVERGITASSDQFPAGKYVMLYEREADGRWRIAWTITNSDAIPPAR